MNEDKLIYPLCFGTKCGGLQAEPYSFFPDLIWRGDSQGCHLHAGICAHW